MRLQSVLQVCRNPFFKVLSRIQYLNVPRNKFSEKFYCNCMPAIILSYSIFYHFLIFIMQVIVYDQVIVEYNF